ncbi:MAG: hypothetical protein IPH55_07230 [Betaproteobacteria bacterium]|nr:hypothetical protein [Betaproteobacteria bacterium]
MQIEAMTTEPKPARRLPRLRRGNVFTLLQTLALAVVVAGCAATATPRVDESELLAQGFKVLVATTTVQKEWVQTLPPGQIRPMQRNDKKYYIYPDAPRNRIYVGGPTQYEAYLRAHPDSRASAQDAADLGRAYRRKDDEVMQRATARDLSDPFLGASWYDLGW